MALTQRQTKLAQLSIQTKKLHVACHEGSLEQVKEILNKNAILIDAPNEAGNTPLMIALKAQKSRVFAYLLTQGASVNVTNHAGQTPLQLACWKNLKDAAYILLQNGADVNSQDLRGWNSLMISAKNGNEEIVWLLLQYKPNINQVDKFGKKAEDRASTQHICDLIHSLGIGQILLQPERTKSPSISKSRSLSKNPLKTTSRSSYVVSKYPTILSYYRSKFMEQIAVLNQKISSKSQKFLGTALQDEMNQAEKFIKGIAGNENAIITEKMKKQIDQHISLILKLASAKAGVKIAIPKSRSERNKDSFPLKKKKLQLKHGISQMVQCQLKMKLSHLMMREAQKIPIPTQIQSSKEFKKYPMSQNQENQQSQNAIETSQAVRALAKTQSASKKQRKEEEKIKRTLIGRSNNQKIQGNLGTQTLFAQTQIPKSENKASCRSPLSPQKGSPDRLFTQIRNSKNFMIPQATSRKIKRLNSTIDSLVNSKEDLTQMIKQSGLSPKQLSKDKKQLYSKLQKDIAIIIGDRIEAIAKNISSETKKMISGLMKDKISFMEVEIKNDLHRVVNDLEKDFKNRVDAVANTRIAKALKQIKTEKKEEIKAANPTSSNMAFLSASREKFPDLQNSIRKLDESYQEFLKSERLSSARQQKTITSKIKQSRSRVSSMKKTAEKPPYYMSIKELASSGNSARINYSMVDTHNSRINPSIDPISGNIDQKPEIYSAREFTGSVHFIGDKGVTSAEDDHLSSLIAKYSNVYNQESPSDLQLFDLFCLLYFYTYKIFYLCIFISIILNYY